MNLFVTATYLSSGRRNCHSFACVFSQNMGSFGLTTQQRSLRSVCPATYLRVNVDQPQLFTRKRGRHLDNTSGGVANSHLGLSTDLYPSSCMNARNPTQRLIVRLTSFQDTQSEI
jgi:hypothetical protein